MDLVTGPVVGPQLIVAYGPEGVGKTTFASRFPDPIFIDVEGSSKEFDVRRTPVPASYTELQGIVSSLTQDPQGAQTIVVDTLDWVEGLIVRHILAENNMSALGGNNDFGHSFNLLDQEFRRFLDSLSHLSDRTGCHVVLLAHTILKKFELPEEAGAYDRWELKLEKKPKAATKEWPSMLLFLTWKVMVTEIDRKKKASDLGRVIRTCHSAAWDAKNRHGFDQEIDLPENALPPELLAVLERSGAPQSASQSSPRAEAPTPALQPAIPVALANLMKASNVTEAQVRWAVAQKGYYPEETAITAYDSSFVENLVSTWDRVSEFIREQSAATGGVA